MLIWGSATEGRSNLDRVAYTHYCSPDQDYFFAASLTMTYMVRARSYCEEKRVPVSARRRNRLWHATWHYQRACAIAVIEKHALSSTARERCGRERSGLAGYERRAAGREE